MSSETRLVRPYVGGEEFQKMLDSCTLRCADEVVEGGGEVSVNLDEYLNYPFALLMEDIDWALAEAARPRLSWNRVTSTCSCWSLLPACVSSTRSSARSL